MIFWTIKSSFYFGSYDPVTHAVANRLPAGIGSTRGRESTCSISGQGNALQFANGPCRQKRSIGLQPAAAGEKSPPHRRERSPRRSREPVCTPVWHAGPAGYWRTTEACARLDKTNRARARAAERRARHASQEAYRRACCSVAGSCSIGPLPARLAGCQPARCPVAGGSGR